MDERLLLGIIVIVFSLTTNVEASAPKFRRAIITNRVALINESAKFVCRVRGKPRPTLVWLFEDKFIFLSERFRIDKYSLQISNLRLSDSGNYSCKASNEHGTIWGTMTLRVVESEGVRDKDDLMTDTFGDMKVPPAWSQKKDTVEYLARPATQSVTMECDARGHPIPNITWFKDGLKIHPVNNKILMKHWALEIVELTMMDKGNYTCIIDNGLGDGLNWTYKLDVIQRLPQAPVIDGVKNQTVYLGANATFTCKILMSDDQPIMQWLRNYTVNGSFVNGAGEPNVKILHQTADEPQYLKLTNVTEEDEGWYTCLVSNSVAVNYRSAWLTVLKVHVDWTAWSSWGSCSVTCGVGIQKRNRDCINSQPEPNENSCSGDSSDYSVCFAKACQVHVDLTAWSSWGSCSVTCGVGIQKRNRDCINSQPEPNENSCSGDSSDYSVCFAKACQDGGWTLWSLWSTCSATCNGGLRTRTRLCDNPTPSMFGRQCSGNNVDKTLCNTQSCPAPVVIFSLYSPSFKVFGGSGTPHFKQVSVNVGGDYNTSTGLFKCRIAGVYRFSVFFNNIQSYYSDLSQCDLLHFDSNTMEPRSYADSKNVHQSLSVYISLTTGDTVALHCENLKLNSAMSFNGELVAQI